jgi:outer membrane protein TolC
MRLAGLGIRRRPPTAGAVVLLLAGCTVGPKYATPATPMSGIFKEATPADYQNAGAWRPARPSDDAASRGKWWQIFGDPELDKLEDELTARTRT